MLEAADGPLYSVLYRSLPGNLPFIRRRLIESLGERLERDDDIAHLLVSNLSRALVTEDDARRAVWTDLSKELKERHEPACRRWRHRRPWAQLRDNSAAGDVMARYGVLPFYVADLVLSGAGYPWVVKLLADDVSAVPQDASPLPEVAHEVRDLLMRQLSPWLPWSDNGSSGRSSFTAQRIEEEPLPIAGEDLATHIVLSLPYLELGVVLKQGSSVIDRLRSGRGGGEVEWEAFERELSDRSIPRHVREFLMRWVRTQVDLVSRPSRTQ
jgi:hypothetical protein